MRKTTTFLVMLLASFGFLGAADLPLDFETGTYGITDFDGGALTIIDNPQSSGINTSAKVAQMIKSAGQPWGGSFITLDNPIDFSTNKLFKMKVYSPRVGAKVLLKVENLSDGAIFFEKEVLTTVANEWEELSFDYSAINPANSYQKIILIFDNGTAGDGSANFTFLLDDIVLTEGAVGLDQIDLPVDFESDLVDYSLTDFGGNNTVLGADPVDADNTVAITTKTAGAETWAGTTVGTDAGFATAIPFTQSATKMTVKVYSPAVGKQIRLKAEDHTDNTKTVETEATTTMANAWEELVFDFSIVAPGTNPYDPSTNFDKLSIFFDFDVAGVNDVYYWDDVMFSDEVASGPDAAPTPPARDAGDVISVFSDAYTDLANTDFNPNWSQSTVVTTEDIDGNATLKYANLNYQGTQFAAPIDASGMDYVHVDMWTDNATLVNFSLISSGPAETPYALPITSGTWVSYDIALTEYSSVVNLSDIIQFKFDGTAGSTIYLDNIYFYSEEVVAGSDATLSDLQVDGATVEGFVESKLNYTVKLTRGTSVVPTVTATPADAAASAAVTPAASVPGATSILVTAADGTTTKTYTVAFVESVELPLDFETGAYTFNNFDGGEVTIIDNPQSGGINTSSKVARMVKNAGQSWGGSYITLDEPIDFSVNKTFKMKVFVPNAGDKVLLKVENGTSGAIAFEKEVASAVGNAWEELTFDYSAIDGRDYQKIVIIFELGTMGDGSADFTYLFDDLELVTVAASDNATLSDLMVDGTTVAGFDAATLNYMVELPYGTTNVPAVNATTADTNASAVVTPAASLPGTTSIVVTAEDGTTTSTYTVEFTLAANDDASLSDLKVDGTTVAGFDAGTLTYTVELPQGTTDVPVVTATETDANANAVVNDAAALPGTTTVVVTAEDGTTSLTYSVEFTLATSVANDSFEDVKMFVFQGILQIEFNQEYLDGSVEVYDMTGRRLLMKQLAGNVSTFEINTEGAIIVRLTDSSDQKTVTRKLVVQ
jgi:hypothetical protein